MYNLYKIKMYLFYQQYIVYSCSRNNYFNNLNNNVICLMNNLRYCLFILLHVSFTTRRLTITHGLDFHQHRVTRCIANKCIKK